MNTYFWNFSSLHMSVCSETKLMYWKLTLFFISFALWNFKAFLCHITWHLWFFSHFYELVIGGRCVNAKFIHIDSCFLIGLTKDIYILGINCRCSWDYTFYQGRQNHLHAFAIVRPRHTSIRLVAHTFIILTLCNILRPTFVRLSCLFFLKFLMWTYGQIPM